MHVLDVESATYAAFVTAGGCDLLPGCRCAFCGGVAVRLTRIRVQRKLQRAVGEFVVLAVALARCDTCRHRERVLPRDVLPGKVTSVTVIFSAVAAVERGERVAAVARRHGVCALTIRLWRAGLGARALDLFGLLRHRAIVAPARAPPGTMLVPFGSFAVEAAHTVGVPEPRLVLGEGHDPAAELRLAAGLLVSFIESLGGALAAAGLGAVLFRAAVLLFRTGLPDTSICVDRTPRDRHGSQREPSPSSSRSQGHRVLALRADRARARRADARRARGDRAGARPRATRAASRSPRSIAGSPSTCTSGSRPSVPSAAPTTVRPGPYSPRTWCGGPIPCSPTTRS